MNEHWVGGWTPKVDGRQKEFSVHIYLDIGDFDGVEKAKCFPFSVKEDLHLVNSWGPGSGDLLFCPVLTWKKRDRRYVFISEKTDSGILTLKSGPRTLSFVVSSSRKWKFLMVYWSMISGVFSSSPKSSWTKVVEAIAGILRVFWVFGKVWEQIGRVSKILRLWKRKEWKRSYGFL